MLPLRHIIVLGSLAKAQQLRIFLWGPSEVPTQLAAVATAPGKVFGVAHSSPGAFASQLSHCMMLFVLHGFSLKASWILVHVSGVFQLRQRWDAEAWRFYESMMKLSAWLHCPFYGKPGQFEMSLPMWKTYRVVPPGLFTNHWASTALSLLAVPLAFHFSELELLLSCDEA